MGERPNSIAVGNGTVFATNYRRHARHAARRADREAPREAPDGRRRRPRQRPGSRRPSGSPSAARPRCQARPRHGHASSHASRLPHRPQAVAVGHGAVWVGMSTLDGSSTSRRAHRTASRGSTPARTRSRARYPMTAGHPLAGGHAARDLDRQSGLLHRLALRSRHGRAQQARERSGERARRCHLRRRRRLGGPVPEEDTVVRIDDRTGRKVSIGVGRHPTGIAARGKQIWVTSFIDHTLTRIDPKTNRTVGKPVAGAAQPLRARGHRRQRLAHRGRARRDRARSATAPRARGRAG